MLLDEIGAGAMGTVWRARQRDTGDTVAVKLLRESFAGDQDLVLRFVQERNMMRTLRHPNIVTVRDFVIEGERLALVMDLVEGGDLRTLLQQRGTLPPAEMARLMAQVADALAFAHEVGIVHRDIKPGNVLIDGATGQVRLTDFGVARIVHGPGLTQTTSIIGTPAYLSPEVAEGSAPTPAVDVYALGLIVYELLAGRPPFVGDHPMALLRQHATAMPRRLPGMPDALWSVISACAAKDPAGRPGAREVAAALSGAAASLAGWPALPRVPREEAPSVTSEALPSTVPPAPGDPQVAGTDGLTTAPPASAAGHGTVTSTRRGRARQRLVIVATTCTALVLSAAAVAVVAPWRATDAGVAPVAAGASTQSTEEPAATAETPSTEVASSPVRSPRVRTERKRAPETTVSEPATPPSSTEPETRRVRTPQPNQSTPGTADPTDDDRPAEPPERDPAPNWRCREWASAGTGSGTEMAPCMALVGDTFYLLGKIRGSSSVRSDIHVQLYNSDAEKNLSQPFICANVSPSTAGEVVTCGPFKATTPRVGAKIDVRQRWRKTGTANFGGGVESPWVLW
ncbi:serine/threonine-protein kinase [Nonomuraea polychroma]|uniref:serine/threonine-protein kinase n=1 Tax=Nonomuraea polychroma TaxID=46176 RepID=UPI0013E2957B|nr:serine/threonine-protein kinase [Nonomuraea polychroma]